MALEAVAVFAADREVGLFMWAGGFGFSVFVAGVSQVAGDDGVHGSSLSALTQTIPTGAHVPTTLRMVTGFEEGQGTVQANQSFLCGWA